MVIFVEFVIVFQSHIHEFLIIIGTEYLTYATAEMLFYRFVHPVKYILVIIILKLIDVRYTVIKYLIWKFL